MFMMKSFIATIIFGLATAQLYVPPKGFYAGVWFDRWNNDTPTLINERLQNDELLGMFQGDMKIGVTDIQTDQLDIIIKAIEPTNAIFYLTVYTLDDEGVRIEDITDAALDKLINKMKEIRSVKNRRIILRILSEMNGSWFNYGQQPSLFIKTWKHWVAKIRKDIEGVDIIWAPNSSNGYPFLGQKYSNNSPSNPEFSALDTNGDGVFDDKDDPFSPYFPGDEWVDWVGISIYHYGTVYPWVDNSLAAPGKFEQILAGTYHQSGRGATGPYNFYEIFSGKGNSITKGGHPFFLTETAGTFHRKFLKDNSTVSPGAGNLAIKQNWWRQIFNQTFLDNHPNFKAVCLFEILKNEEDTVRDFRSLATSEMASAFAADVKGLGLVSPNSNFDPNAKNPYNNVSKITDTTTDLNAASNTIIGVTTFMFACGLLVFFF